MNVYGVFYYYTDKSSYPDVLIDYRVHMSKEAAQKIADEKNIAESEDADSTVRFYVKELRVI